MSKIEVKAIPSSFVAKNMKLYSDTGAGEAKLFVGSTRNTKEFNDFFEFESDYKYRFSKENLLQYLDQMKLEYGFQKINRYKNVSLETWEENYNNISSMNADEFYFELYSFSDKSRFYIRSDDELFKKTFRNLVVPKLTNAIFSKDEVAKIITIKLDINFDADTLTDVSKTVSVEGIPALSIEDLGRILKDMYNNAKESGQVAAIHMFGFKYGDIITASGYSQKAIISLAGINDSYSAELNKGVNIYKSVKANEYGVSFDENPIKDEDMLSHNVYGIHITGKSNALSSENPHICIGWSKMGDLSSCADKDSISEKYAKTWPNAKAKSRGQNVGQIYRFVVESKIGDYIVFGDGSTAHIGVIASDYYYQENPQDQDPDYVNNKSVKWLKDVPYAELSSQFKNSLGSAKSFFRLNDYKSVIAELLNGTYTKDNTADDQDSTVQTTCDRQPRSNKVNPLNLIIYGAPGTGKTYSTTEYAVATIEGRQVRKDLSADDRKTLMDQYRALAKDGKIVFTTFHQNYGYEDFIQGLRPTSNNGALDFVPVNGVFKKIANTAMSDQENNYVIIIDEINRGNISKIFGELITLIEDDKRWGEDNQLSVTLPSGEEFAVPNNLYIIGTMNSADKSIALIDTALRRRFEFEEVAPNPELIVDETLKKVLVSLNELLRKQLESSDLLIGHAYFIGKTAADLSNILNRNIIPLLYEYFYDQEKKVKDALAKVLEGTDVSIAVNNQGRIKVE